MRWASGPVPVAIEAAHTGVTDGNAATESSTYTPRCRIAASAGARPVVMARSIIDGLQPSITARTSFLAIYLRMRRPAYFSPERRRPPISNQPRKPTSRIDTGGSRMASAAPTSEARSW